jgi:hypothetical protein
MHAKMIFVFLIRAIWDMEDEELLVAAKQHLETLRKRHSSVT